ncbi:MULTISPECIES: c-type cytochrome [unclassified Sphingobium]|uniref:c-type cytochrome n=1 Tax=unclassified Sphingobium TaxID=2611147 RepID=UPI00222414C1|nr:MULTISPECIES: cytochrome c [unclassified Sphingobium]MCW2351359.1 mono/diheme cytochrome c family protein [Sphingobium sp. B12D2B]MCW2370581.1 mono/diheme cytochrome c family protein [Sphingobium sp. B11D3D]MCW2380834.1 mono/diheme cytochrome c family protein [Sphingobium sp. B2D3B]MCW2389025.1 mono/diheme cytochrome c family protein [Sphingobium sp. B11D3B]MCW2395561.1 mono/diheme cytochrome c family protein [Sphingobium sp. B8D3B]
MTLKTAAALALAGALLAATVAVRAQDAPGGGPTSVDISNEGKEVYEMICQACHMADGKGGAGAGAAIPAIAGNANLADKDFIATILVKGRGGMPWFTDMLTPEQMAAVATYARSHFNNYPDPVTAADVKRVIAANGSSTRDCSTC